MPVVLEKRAKPPKDWIKTIYREAASVKSKEAARVYQQALFNIERRLVATENPISQAEMGMVMTRFISRLSEGLKAGLRKHDRDRLRDYYPLADIPALDV